jgi:hypothetical protein
MSMFHKSSLSRRAFIARAAMAATALLGFPGGAKAQSPPPVSEWQKNLFPRSSEEEKVFRPDFTPAQLRYSGGRWQEYPTAMASFLAEVRNRTSIETAQDAQPVDISSPEIFEYPFLYMSGRYEFEMPDSRAIDNLRRHLTYGGFLLIDDGLGLEEEAFGGAAKKLMRLVFPRNSFEALQREHAVFKSYYLIRSIGGRQAVSQDLQGIHVGMITPVIFCQNDLGGAWARGPGGGWLEECTPGGETQRLAAFQLAVNIALYAMTGNYKQDLIHHPFIQRRLNQG